MLVAEEKNLKVLIDGLLKDSLDAVCEKKHISLKDGIESLIRLLLDQDDLGQSMMLGQVDATPDLLRVLVSRSGRRKAARLSSPKGPQQ